MARPGRRLRWARKVPWVVLALRLIVVSLLVQTGGVARDASDVVWAFALGADAPDDDDDCLKDRGSCHCPPGCPNCHCSHGVASLPQSAVESLVTVRLTNGGRLGLPSAERSPPLPFRSSVYRPPRFAVYPTDV